MSTIIEVSEDYSLPLRDIKEIMGIKPHDSFKIEILNDSIIQLKRINRENSLMGIVDNPAILGRPVTSEELRRLDEEIWGQ